MATLAQLYAEHAARCKRLEEARRFGWTDCIPWEREQVAEIEHVLKSTLLSPDIAKHLVALAGDLELGPLPSGISLAFSGSDS